MKDGGPLAGGPGRIIAALVALVLAAELAVLVLSPADPLDPVAVQADRYFEPAQIERAADYRGGQTTLGLIGLAVEIGVLSLLAAGRPRGAGRLLTKLGERPILGALAAGALIALLLAVVALPTGLIAHDRAVDAGISTQSAGSWLADRAKAAAITALLLGIGAMVLVGLQRRLPRAWWAVGAVTVVAYAAVSTWLAPVVLAPLFNDFDELPGGPARTGIVSLAEQAGVEVGDVLVVDASRRGTSINAYVNGIGSTKRVVIYDNLLERGEGPVLRSVLAHELGHVAAHDIRRGLTFVAITAPLGMLLVALGGAALCRRRGISPGTPAALPVYGVLIVVVSFGINLAGNQLSRAVEARADAYALELTDDPEAFIRLQQELATTNLSDPDPGGAIDRILRTHPATVDRIGSAIAYRRQQERNRAS